MRKNNNKIYLTSIIPFLALLLIIEKYWPAFLIGIILFFILCAIIPNKNSEQSRQEPELRFNQTAKRDAQNEYDILYLQSLLKEMDDCEEIINNSDDVDSVKQNLDRLLAIMDEIMSYPEKKLNEAEMTKSTMPQQKAFVLENYDVVIEQARARNVLKNQPNSTPKPSPIEAEKIPKELNFDLSEVENWQSWPSERILNMFFKLSHEIDTNKNTLLKLEACEKSYKILKPAINALLENYDELPPIVACREYGPYTYRRLGNWQDAERVINICIDANAYEEYEIGKEELEYLTIYKKIGEIAIDFIKKNPGFLQKDIYKTLSQQVGEDNIPVLKEFMRETYIFHKEPYKGSNKLYYIERE